MGSASLFRITCSFVLKNTMRLVGAVQAIYMVDLKVHHRYAPKQFLYLNYAAAASEVSTC